MQSLNLPIFPLKIKSENNKNFVYDEIRKKYVKLSPEEWVRQNFIKFLCEYKNYPASLIGVEVSIDINNTSKRADIVLFNRNGKPLIIIECKAPEVNIDATVFDQIGIYNMYFNTSLFIVTNGLTHFCFKKSSIENKFEFLKDIPSYEEIMD